MSNQLCFRIGPQRSQQPRSRDAPSQRSAPRVVLWMRRQRRQFEVAVVDKARFVFSYLWPRIDASPAELERGAKIWNRNSYNKDVKAATWLVARTAAALDKI